MQLFASVEPRLYIGRRDFQIVHLFSSPNRCTIFEPKLNRFVAGGHDRLGACTGKATGPETSEAACRRTRESPRCSLPRDNSESAPGPLAQELVRAFSSRSRRESFLRPGWPRAALVLFSGRATLPRPRAARPERHD